MHSFVILVCLAPAVIVQFNTANALSKVPVIRIDSDACGIQTPAIAEAIQNLKDNVEPFLLGTERYPLASCATVPADKLPGYYWIKPSDSQPAVQQYCDLVAECGGSTGWTRVGFLNMSDPAENCPEGWMLQNLPPRTCGSRSNDNSTGCYSVIYPASGMTYNQVCGRVLAYHTGGSEGFNPSINLESNYIDGISLTHGPQNSRQHIWSFVTAVGEVGNYQTVWLCDCSNGDAWPHSTGIVGNNYFCDTGNHNVDWSAAITYPDDPLWDGEGCGPSSTCCQFNNPPWFSVSLPQPISDDLEVRNCRITPGSFGFDNLVQLIEIYVQ